MDTINIAFEDEVRITILTPANEMADMQLEGSRGAVQIITSNKKTGAITLNEDALAKILLREDIRDKHVVVVSVCGAYRQGKSFILDFFLHYLNAENSDDWLGRKNEPLTGFSWRGGTTSHTEGIHMWNHPFIKKTSSGEEVVVFLLDTQVTLSVHSLACPPSHQLTESTKYI